MVQPLRFLPETPSQTAGPFVHIGALPATAGVGARDLGAEPFPGASDTRLSGRVLDGTGAPVTDAIVEFWQADDAGRHPTDGRGFARRGADPETGEWRLATLKPGPVAAPGGGHQAPHITLWIVARGINIGLHTRLYFPGDDHSGDPVLSRLDPTRRDTLIAAETGEGRYRFDIVLQGAGETVFLDI